MTLRRPALSPSVLRLLLTAALALLLAATVPSACASSCSACQYTAHNCSALSSDGASTSASDPGVSVCDAAGLIQIDDVFCDDDECHCGGDRRCASLVIGCSNVFQARSRKRCIGHDTEQRRFSKCAVAQALTTRSDTNLEADWVFFKDAARCRSGDCDAVRQFHNSGVVKCGYLIVAWKDSDALFHFVVDGSRASDMAAGVFHYQAPFAGGALAAARVAETRINECYALQTRNQNDGAAACDGYYIKYDTAVQFTSGDDYKLSELSDSVWRLVVGSVAAAVVAVAGVAVFVYRLRRADAADGADAELLDDVDGDASATNKAGESILPTTKHELRQRTLSPRASDSDEATRSSTV